MKKQSKKKTAKDLLQALSLEAVTRLQDLLHSDNEAIVLHASFYINALNILINICGNNRIQE